MLGSPKKNRIDLKSNAALIVSFLGLAVSSLALYNGFIANDISRNNFLRQEEAIRPYISFQSDPDNKRLYLKNTGLGTAVVKRIVFALENNCIDIDLSKSSPDRSDGFFKKINHNIRFHLQNLIREELYKARLPGGVSYEYDFTIGHTANQFRSEFSISPKDEVDIYRAEFGIKFISEDLLDKYGMNKKDILTRSFADGIYPLMMRVEYCSLSGYLCYPEPTLTADRCKI